MVSVVPDRFQPTRWPQIERVAVRCLALLAHPERRAVLRAGEQQRRIDVAAQVGAREARR